MKTTIRIFLFCSILFSCSKQNEDVALLVNGKKITKQQITQASETFRQNVINSMPEKALESISSDLRSTVAQQLITNQLMIEDAKKRKILIDSNMVDKAFEKFKSSYPNQTDFEKELTAMGETESSVKKELEKGALLDTLLKIILQSSDTVNEQECKHFYDKNSFRYSSSPRFRASQIFLPADSLTDKVKWEKSRKEALQLIEKLKGGQKFEAIVSRYAKTQSDGDIGWFKEGDLKMELQSAIQSKKVGEISDVICTEIGFHILKKTDEEAGKTLPFDEVKDNIRMMLSLKKKTDFITHYADSIISKAKITYLDSSLVPKKVNK